MSRYEQRLHSSISRSMRELEKLRGTKPSEWKNLPPSPFLAKRTRRDATWPPDVIDEEEIQDVRDELNEALKCIQELEEAEAAEAAALSDEEDGDGDDGDDGDRNPAVDEPIVQNEPTAAESVATPSPAESSVAPAGRTSPTVELPGQDVRTADPAKEAVEDEPVTPERPKRPLFRAY